MDGDKLQAVRSDVRFIGAVLAYGELPKTNDGVCTLNTKVI